MFSVVKNKSMTTQYIANTILRGDTTTSDSKYIDLLPKPQENIYNYFELEENLEVPDSFDGKQVWKDFLTPVANQKTCGSCWAFSAVTSLSDRFNLHSMGRLQLRLSPVPIVLCDTHGAKNPKPLKDLEQSVKLFEAVQKLYGCNGNLLSEAWRMLYTLGTNTETCMPLDILRFQSPSSCIKLMGPAGDMCSDYRFNYLNNIEYGTPAKFYSTKYVYSIPGVPADNGSELNIRKDIYKYGPISTAMELYPDFFTFDHSSGKIYQSNYDGGRQFGHAVVIDGWGEQNRIKFWWVRNSWGSDWGMKGYFKMLRGSNHCKIEENVITGIPNISSANFFLNIQNLQTDIQTKFSIHSYENMAGGIDPDNGYSRRILSFLKYKNELNMEEKTISTPDYNTFIAGKINKKMRQQDLRNLELQSAVIPTGLTTNELIIISICSFGLLLALLQLMRIRLSAQGTFPFSSFYKT